MQVQRKAPEVLENRIKLFIQKAKEADLNGDGVIKVEPNKKGSEFDTFVNSIVAPKGQTSLESRKENRKLTKSEFDVLITTTGKGRENKTITPGQVKTNIAKKKALREINALIRRGSRLAGENKKLKGLEAFTEVGKAFGYSNPTEKANELNHLMTQEYGLKVSTYGEKLHTDVTKEAEHLK